MVRIRGVLTPLRRAWTRLLHEIKRRQEHENVVENVERGESSVNRTKEHFNGQLKPKEQRLQRNHTGGGVKKSSSFRCGNEDMCYSKGIQTIVARRVQKTLRIQVQGFIETLKEHLLPEAQHRNDVIAVIRYKKLLGDQYRYLLEFHHSDTDLDTSILGASEAIVYENRATTFYEAAWSLAENILPRTDILYLTLALNYANFMFTVKKSRYQACELGLTVHDEAVLRVDSVPEKQRCQVQQLLRMLRGVLHNWADILNT